MLINFIIDSHFNSSSSSILYLLIGMIVNRQLRLQGALFLYTLQRDRSIRGTKNTQKTRLFIKAFGWKSEKERNCRREDIYHEICQKCERKKLCSEIEGC